ncbi:hypothetical protein [Chryseobacterium sp.]|uniref:hypothetical protein n=1 Tax=Chryseobacterium sp. TaxID=1871047 RepID=UPI00289A5C79|nr:hypothetical protein [Chryseobacterium sp.]
MQKINKFNQYLLEKYPTVWNTKLVWMLLAAFVFHVIFFVIGYLSHMNPVTLQTTYVKDDYFRHGLILVHIIISVLMIVVWLIMMFKNNAFKNFYPQSQGKLFSQFVQYFVIIFASTTFYFSYMTGFKMFINYKYPDSEMVKNVETINRASAFLSQNTLYYDLSNRLYPKPFYDLYCETDIKKIDRTKKYFVNYNRVYQYYSLYSKKSYQRDKRKQFISPEPETTDKKEIIYSQLSDDEKFYTYYYKKDVVDVSSYIPFTGFSYYNYSELFYNSNAENGRYNHYDYATKIEYENTNTLLKKKNAEINRKTAELLDKNNIAEIEKLLSDFLKISKEYNIENNLDASQWAKMVYNPKDYQIRYFIKTYKNQAGTAYDPNNRPLTDQGDYAVVETVDAPASAAVVDGVIVDDSVQIKDFNPEINKQLSPEDYFKKNTTEYYYYTDTLKDLLESVDEVKAYDFYSESIHIYLWIAFFLSTFVLSFRIAGLKSLLFSIISAGLLMLVVTLTTVMYSISVSGKEEFFVAYLVLFISLFILSVPIFMMNRFNKMVTSVFLNISLNGFVLFILLIFGIISIHQDATCRTLVADIEDYYPYQKCPNLLEDLGLWTSYIILIIGFVFMYFYSSVIMKWKARPE